MTADGLYIRVKKIGYELFRKYEFKSCFAFCHGLGQILPGCFLICIMGILMLPTMKVVVRKLGESVSCLACHL